jgi:two-component system OmpR family sensor kinase
MIFKSIKWRLQLWYGLILVAVLVGFGMTAYQLERNRIFRRVDDEIHRRINLLAQQLRRPPRGPMPGWRPGDEGPPPDQIRGAAPPDRMGRPSRFELPPQAAALFGTNVPGNFYFRIRFVTDQGDNEIAHSENYRHPTLKLNRFNPYFIRQNRIADLPGKPPKPPPPVNIEEDRIAEEMLPSEELIEVGCSIAPELLELKMTALKLAGFGGVILFIGFAGGWWFVGRALRPIAAISSTATKISGGDLSQRISTAETESELGQLGAVLNSTFARLETAFAQQKQFAADAAHELRTPVTVILTQTQMALARERDAAGYRQTVEACHRAAQRMRKLIESLLELARFDAGQEVLNRLPFDLAQTVADCAEMVQPLAEERRVKIITELKPLQFTGDSERLAQVVANLLTNAIQYNRPEGEVRVKLVAQDGLAVLEISDTGQGIAPTDLPHVFERFYRADKSRTGGGHAGLGLSICKAIVEAHGGTIEVSSAENGGTRLVVRLPV